MGVSFGKSIIISTGKAVNHKTVVKRYLFLSSRNPTSIEGRERKGKEGKGWKMSEKE